MKGEPGEGGVLVQVWSGSETALEQECNDLDEAAALFNELDRDDRAWPKFDFTINGVTYDTIDEARAAQEESSDG